MYLTLGTECLNDKSLLKIDIRIAHSTMTQSSYRFKQNPWEHWRCFQRSNEETAKLHPDMGFLGCIELYRTPAPAVAKNNKIKLMNIKEFPNY